MFATLSGPLPCSGSAEDWIRQLLALQVDAGLEPLTDGQCSHDDLGADVARAVGVAAVDGRLVAGRPITAPSGPLVVDEWRRAAAMANRPVKQALPGPYSLARRVDAPERGREALTFALADVLRSELVVLADAGCPLVEIEEPAAIAIGEDEAERELFRAAQQRLLADDPAIHRTLVVVGGNADAAGAETVFDAPYHSYLFDLIEGPDNWRLIARAPAERGIVCGVITARAPSESQVLLAWAAHYAASTGGRGLDRVGLANAGSMRSLDIDGVAKAARLLAAAARLAGSGSWDEVASRVGAKLPERWRESAQGEAVPPSGGPTEGA